MKKIEYISIDNLHPHPANPRKNLGDLTELTDSIKAKGVLQNLTVVPYWSPVHKRVISGLYTIIIGHRRHEAAKLAGLTELPCVIAEMTPQEQLETMMVENIQRSDLTVYEQAEGFQLMLDMGSTVAHVAQKTGLSETTVRNRAKLTNLDKSGFKKAEERGATLTDFLKLNDIKDDTRRNEVLKSLGTADFNQRYHAAIRAEKDEKWLADTIDAFRNADWCEEITAEQRDTLNGRHIEYLHNYGTHNKRECVKPEDADRRLYFFYVGKIQVDLYREISKKKTEDNPEPEVSPAELKRREVADQIDELMAECEDMEQDFRNMRENFIDEFDRYERYREEIQEFMVNALLFRDVPIYKSTAMIDREELAGMLNIGYDKAAGQMNQEELNRLLRTKPERVLLSMAYLLLEDGNRKWTIKCYEGSVKTSRPTHREDKQLNLLYDCLRSLGYDWSMEEQRASVGDLLQFPMAKRLVEEYEEESSNG